MWRTKPVARSQDFEPPICARTLRRLVLFEMLRQRWANGAVLVEEFALGNWKQTNSSRRVATMARVLVLGGVGFLPLLFWFRFSTTPYEPFAHTGWLMRALLSVPAAFVLQIVLAVPVWLLCRRSLALIFGVQYLFLVVPYLAYVGVGAFNVTLDDQPPQRVAVRLVRHIPSLRGMASDEIMSWKSPNQTLTLTGFDFRLGADGHPRDLLVHRGAFGLEWVSQAH